MEDEVITSPTEEILNNREEQLNPLASELEEHALENQNISTNVTETSRRPNYILKKNAQITNEVIKSKEKNLEALIESEAYTSFYGKPEEISAHFEKEQNLIDKKESGCKMVYTFKDLKLNKEYKETFYLKKYLLIIQITDIKNHINSRKYSNPKLNKYPYKYYFDYPFYCPYHGYYNGYYAFNFGCK